TPTITPLRTSTVETVGSIGGVLALLALPLLTVGLVRRRRQHRWLRAELLDVENRRAPLLAAAEAMRTTLVVPARPAPPAAPTRPTPPPTPASHVTVRAGSDTP
ncbi:MAG: hypothetical protein ACLQA5_13990, partial [Solirubrobacteraceae bacterium]